MLNWEQSKDPREAQSKRQNKEPTSTEVRGVDVITVTGASSAGETFFVVRRLFVVVIALAILVDVEEAVEVDVVAVAKSLSLLLFPEFSSTMVVVVVVVQELMNSKQVVVLQGGRRVDPCDIYMCNFKLLASTAQCSTVMRRLAW